MQRMDRLRLLGRVQEALRAEMVPEGFREEAETTLKLEGQEGGSGHA